MSKDQIFLQIKKGRNWRFKNIQGGKWYNFAHLENVTVKEFYEREIQLEAQVFTEVELKKRFLVLKKEFPNLLAEDLLLHLEIKL